MAAHRDISFCRQCLPVRSAPAFVSLAALLLGGCSKPSIERLPLDIATTTSVVNSGAMDALLPLFQDESGITVRVHAAGSGRALAMLGDGIVRLVISHAPQAEARMLATHPQWTYAKIATNEFMIVGPPEDPANIRGATDAASAFRRIASKPVYFLSRGDGSGTHEREMELWSAAELKPDPNRVLISGAGMGATLRQADERRAYTLTDDATFMQLRARLTLQPLFMADPRLVNSYAVIFEAESPEGLRFAKWLTIGNGRRALAAYRVGGTQPFRVWPEGCPRADPLAPLCQSAQ